MKTWTTESIITADQKLKIELPCDLPPGPVEVVVVVQSQSPSVIPARRQWDELLGLGKEVWQGIDPKEYVRELRQDREFSP